MPDLSSQLKSAFQKFDTDKSSTISREKLQTVLTHLNPSFTQRELDTLFSVADKNKDGIIQYEEFLDFICYLHEKEMQLQKEQLPSSRKDDLHFPGIPEQKAGGAKGKKQDAWDRFGESGVKQAASHPDHAFHEFSTSKDAPQQFPGVPQHKPAGGEKEQKRDSWDRVGGAPVKEVASHPDHAFHEFSTSKDAPQQFPGVPQHKPAGGEKGKKKDAWDRFGGAPVKEAASHPDHAFHEFSTAKDAPQQFPGVPEHKPTGGEKEQKRDSWDRVGGSPVKEAASHPDHAFHEFSKDAPHDLQFPGVKPAGCEKEQKRDSWDRVGGSPVKETASHPDHAFHEFSKHAPHELHFPGIPETK